MIAGNIGDGISAWAPLIMAIMYASNFYSGHPIRQEK